MPNNVSISQAANVLQSANRVLVVGCSGGGKSTLSIKISERFGLDYLSYDRDVRWLPGWQVRDRQEQRLIVADLVKRDRWIMDGTTVSTFDLRLPRADLLIWVRVPRRVALTGIARRVLANYGKVRTDMAEGCPEKLPDCEFLTFIWTFETRMAPRISSGIDRHGPEVPVVTLRSHREFAELLDA
ncbi:P-loop NTPase family protein [Roseivivax lentus]|nr:AAA family ATPase [Roseivivax lentus]